MKLLPRKLSTKLLLTAVWNTLFALFMVVLCAFYIADRRWGFGFYFFAIGVFNGSFAWKGWRDGYRERREEDQRRTSGGSGSYLGAFFANTPGPGSAALPYAGEGPRVADLDVPDSATPILAWRTWKIDSGQLGSPTRDCLWPAGAKLEAKCIFTLQDAARRLMQSYKDIYGIDFLDPHDSHGSSPCDDCLCGIYALKDPEEIFNYRGVVFGEVKLWGKVIEGEKGYRAQFAYPSRLWMKLPQEPEFAPITDVVRSVPNDEIQRLITAYEGRCRRAHEAWEDEVGVRLEQALQLSESYGVPVVPLFPDQKKMWLEAVAV